MKKSHQEAIGIEEQVKNLIDLGLTVKDEGYAKKVLERVSYYRLIKAYSITLKKNGRYIEWISFDDIIDLYTFDRIKKRSKKQMTSFIKNFIDNYEGG